MLAEVAGDLAREHLVTFAIKMDVLPQIQRLARVVLPLDRVVRIEHLDTVLTAELLEKAIRPYEIEITLLEL